MDQQSKGSFTDLVKKFSNDMSNCLRDTENHTQFLNEHSPEELDVLINWCVKELSLIKKESLQILTLPVHYRSELGDFFLIVLRNAMELLTKIYRYKQKLIQSTGSNVDAITIIRTFFSYKKICSLHLGHILDNPHPTVTISFLATTNIASDISI